MLRHPTPPLGNKYLMGASEGHATIAAVRTALVSIAHQVRPSGREGGQCTD
jgi:hypothetical protein